ncbi:glycosyltransferase [Acaryochloris sp. CCMEE 5410]|uniref:glycosyltransferase n=1 Tax=Acaryochloris sp. CCMEE 5410 TaxID=310037 RepID=UPI0002484416|nr:glycosyltransferase [Acaryochloris sp. CCMEE 5410]KAI9132537.1 glycosyltransferase [Acaryochloris sp. CCMEE 5410]
MNIIVFNSLLLPPSQTFIRDPAEKLERFTAYYVGSRRVEGLELPLERTLVVNQGNLLGKVEEQVFKLTGFAPQLYQQIKALNPALIHAQFGLSGVLMLPWVKDLEIPLIVHYRGADATISEADSKYTSLNHWLYFQKKETLKHKAQLFLTVSQFIRQKLIAQGFPEDKILNHYHGVDIQKFWADPKIAREPIVLFVGRLTEKKGCKYLLEAMTVVQRECPDVELVIIGDGPLRSELETIALRSLKKYQFLGVQPPEKVKSWMNRAHLLAAPSVTSSQGDAEGLPNVVLEAQAMSLPVVSTVHAGIPEAVIDSETGYLSPEADSQGLAASMVRLFQDHTLWQTMSYKGREHVETQFDRAKQTKVLEGIYESVLSGRI